MPVVFEKPTDLGEYLFAIQDNGGESGDRYTVVFSDGDYLAMSGSPSHPQGISLTGEDIDPAALQEWAQEGRAVYMALGDLPEHLQLHIIGRLNEGWRDILAAIEAREPHACAPTRDKAKIHEGNRGDGGVGIYSAGAGYCVRTDMAYPDDAAEDFGPYMTAAEALRATLPDRCTLAGDEYQSPVDPDNMTPTPGVAEWIAKREAELDAVDDSAFDAKMTKIFGED